MSTFSSISYVDTSTIPGGITFVDSLVSTGLGIAGDQTKRISRYLVSADDPNAYPEGDIVDKRAQHFEIRWNAEFNFSDEMSRIGRDDWQMICDYVKSLQIRIASLIAEAAPSAASSDRRLESSALASAMRAPTIPDVYGQRR